MKLKKPDVPFTMDDLDISTDSINGKASTAVRNIAERIEVTEGKLNNAIHEYGSGMPPGWDGQLYYYFGGNYQISVEGNDCFCNFVFCAEQKISISFWVKPYEHFGYGEIIAASPGVYGPTIGRLV